MRKMKNCNPGAASWSAKWLRQVAELERTNRLRRFLPEPVAAMIVNAGGGSTGLLNSQRRTVTVLFADLARLHRICQCGCPRTGDRRAQRLPSGLWPAD